MHTVRIAQMGLGPLGVKIVNLANERKGVKVTCAIDSNPQLVGQDLGVVCGGKPCGIKIVASIKELNRKDFDVVILSTVSDMRRIAPQIEDIVALGVPIVSTCEELSCPWHTSPRIAARIDRAAKTANVAVLGTGVNPGFLMDFLPVALTGVSQSVEKIKVSRIQNAEFRRIPFQQKIGAGLSLEEFEKKRLAGTLRHVGLTESMYMVASRLGWKLESTADELSPIVADREINTAAISIKPGFAAGVQQIGRGFVNGEEKITMVFRAAIGEPDPCDRVEITGNPNIDSKIIGGVNGDIATCAIVINAVRQIINCQPGLQTMTDIPVISYFSE